MNTKGIWQAHDNKAPRIRLMWESIDDIELRKHFRCVYLFFFFHQTDHMMLHYSFHQNIFLHRKYRQEREKKKPKIVRIHLLYFFESFYTAIISGRLIIITCKAVNIQNKNTTILIIIFILSWFNCDCMYINEQRRKCKGNSGLYETKMHWSSANNKHLFWACWNKPLQNKSTFYIN